MSSGNRVLVIDDDIAVRLRVGDMLAQIGGFELAEADDGQAGLDEARRMPPDLILLDIMMPGMTGFEVCKALREDSRTSEIPIIVLSAAPEHDAMIEAIEGGADDFLRKPFYGPELQAKIRTITRLNRFRRLAGERNRFRWLLDHSQEPLIVADNNGAVVYANDRARELFALPAEPGSDLVAAVSRHFRSEPVDAWLSWRALRAESAPAFAVYQPETPQVPARWFAVEMQDFDTDASQTLLKFTEHSGWVQREVDLYTFQRLISHKIRTPLNGLSPVLSVLNDPQGTEEGEREELLQIVRGSAERLNETLTSILRHQQAIFSAPCDPVNAPWHSLESVILAAVIRAGLADRVTLQIGSAKVQDPERLEVVLTEVLENYLKFSEAPKWGVKLTLQREAGDRWNLCCFAPGPGLPPDVLAQLGRPFWQLEKSFSGEVPGVGLGLATARMLMRQIGGEIRFARGEVKSGLVTTLTLPAVLFKIEPDHEQ